MRLLQMVTALGLMLVLAVACLVQAQSSSPSLELTVVQVQVLHRHGARAATPSANASAICTEAPCGYLSWAGKEMLLNTSAFLRARYNNDSAVVQTPMFESPNYDLDVVYSRSTDVLRTLQSAEAFLRGFFPNTSSLYPAIHTVTDATDMLLNSGAQPWLKFFYSNNKPLLQEICNPMTDALYPDWTVLTEIGKEIHLEGFCGNYTTRSDCARTLFDIGAAKMAVGELGLFPLLQSNFEQLQNITTVLFAYEYHYNQTDPLMFRQGGRGQPFLQQLVANMDDHVSGSNTYKLIHYSAHDTTLAPVWGTLGDDSATAMLPPFAQVMVTELLQSSTNSSLYVRVLRGNPGQSPDTGFAFVWDDTWHMQCMDAWGNAYVATSNTCPLEDFKRYVSWSEPGDAKGYCYLDDAFVAIAGCPAEGVLYGAVAAQTVSSTCQFYRNACPSFACVNGYTLNSVSYECVCSEDACLDVSGTGEITSTTLAPPPLATSHNSGLSGGAVAGVSIATFVVGAAIAILVTSFVCLMKSRRHAREAGSKYAPLEGGEKSRERPTKSREEAIV